MVRLSCPHCKTSCERDMIYNCHHCKHCAHIDKFIVNEMVIGEYILAIRPDSNAWIVMQDGEGFGFDLNKLELIIKKFYYDNF